MLIYSFHCVNLFNWFHFERDVTQHEIAPQQWAGELKCEHKRSPFCDWISVHSVRTIKFTIVGGTTCGLELISGVQRVYRVCIVHEIVGVGGLFEWGGLARELRTLMEVLALVLAPRGWAVKARYEKPLCAKYIHNIHCTALHQKSWMWTPSKYPDLTDKNFPCV